MDAVKKKTNLFINHLENMYKNKNILITGGLGFIGSNLAIKLVEQGANVTIIDSLIPNYGGNFLMCMILLIKSTSIFLMCEISTQCSISFKIKIISLISLVKRVTLTQ